MARNWCGFDAQNEGMKELWGALEASRDEIFRWLLSLPDPEEQTGEPADENDVIYIPE